MTKLFMKKEEGKRKCKSVIIEYIIGADLTGAPVANFHYQPLGGRI